MITLGLFEKLYTVLIISSVLIGLIIGQVDGIEIFADKIILPLLIIMPYLTFLQIPVKDIKRSFSNRKFTLISLGMNFILTPLLAWMLAATFLADNPALWLGFIMLMVTPCTDRYIIFTGFAKRNVALSTSVLPLNLILQLLLLPLYLYLFSGTLGVVDFSVVVESVLFVLILPFTAAHITRSYLLKKKSREEKLLEKISSLPDQLYSYAWLS